MKKTILILIIFSFISVMPSFGLKLITNNEADRTVPSRCSGYNQEEFVEQNYSSDIYKRYQGYQVEKFETFYKPVLSQNIRRELIGTVWYKQPDKIIQQAKTVDKDVEKLSKSYIREAADYYYVDTIANPKKTIPIGY